MIRLMITIRDRVRLHVSFISELVKSIPISPIALRLMLSVSDLGMQGSFSSES